MRPSDEIFSQSVPAGSKRRRFLKFGVLYSGILFLIVASVFVFFGLACARPTGALYRAATSAGPPAWKMDVDVCWGDNNFWLVPSDYVVRDGKLYLRIQTQRSLGILIASQDEWDAARISAFRLAHPELEGYWPDASRSDGGVMWLRAKSP